MHLSNLWKYQGAFFFLYVLNKWRRISGSSPDISPLRGSTGYVRASKDADNEYWLVPENKVGSGSGPSHRSVPTNGYVLCILSQRCFISRVELMHHTVAGRQRHPRLYLSVSIS